MPGNLAQKNNMKRFNSSKWITENKYGNLGEKKDYTSTEDFGTLFPDAMKGGLGKARANMPQVPADDFETDLESPAGDGLETNEPEKIPDLGKATKAYLDSSDDTGPWPKGDQVDVSVEKGIDPMDLKPTQADIYMSNALKKVKSAEEGSWKPWASSVLASNDGHILDGHHRWAATIVYNDKHGTDEKMSINKVGMPIKDLLKVANAYTDAHPKGVRQGGAGTATEGMSPEEWADAKEKERLNQHPEKDKINKIKQMMDKEEDDKEQAEYDKGWYGENLKEKATELGYLKEVDGMEGVDEQGLDQIERGINHITDGGRQSARVSDRGDKIKVMFRYMRGEFDGETWEAILEYLSDNMGYKILDQSNYYEANYDREEPAEAVPTIYLQK